MASLPTPPVYELRESSGGAGSVEVTLANGKDWTHEQKAHALGPLVYLCVTTFGPRVAKVNIEHY